MQHAFCTFLCRPVVARLQHESCQLHLLSVKTRQPLPFSFSELIYRPLDSVYSRKNRRHLTKWIRWIKNDEFGSSANSLFKWRFRRRCCRGSVNAVDVYCFFFLRELAWNATAKNTKTKQYNHLAFIILLHQEHKWKMFIEVDGEESVLLLVKVRSYTHR